MKIPFLKRYQANNEIDFINKALQQSLEGDGFFTEYVITQLKELTNSNYIIPTTSCTHALELAIRLAGIKSGDEVILPSFTYPSTANAVLLAGGVPIFSKVNSNTLNLDVKNAEELITEKTKAIIPVHYGGAACEMYDVSDLAKKYDLLVIEDAAQGIDSYFDGKHLGTIGDYGCISFHGTKNITSGEGGVLLIKDEINAVQAEIFKDKGTNRRKFINGEVSNYEWVGIGSSYSPSELLMAILSAQLIDKDIIGNMRKTIYERYLLAFENIKSSYYDLPKYKREINHNGHIFFLNFYEKKIAIDFIKHMKSNGIDVRTHYIPLHQSVMGKNYNSKINDLKSEDNYGNTVVRLPIYPNLSFVEQTYIIKKATEWLK